MQVVEPEMRAPRRAAADDFGNFLQRGRRLEERHHDSAIGHYVLEPRDFVRAREHRQHETVRPARQCVLDFRSRAVEHRVESHEQVRIRSSSPDPADVLGGLLALPVLSTWLAFGLSVALEVHEKDFDACIRRMAGNAVVVDDQEELESLPHEADGLT